MVSSIAFKISLLNIIKIPNLFHVFVILWDGAADARPFSIMVRTSSTLSKDKENKPAMADLLSERGL